MKIKLIMTGLAGVMMLAACSSGAKSDQGASSADPVEAAAGAQSDQAFKIKNFNVRKLTKAGNCSIDVAVNMDFPVSGEPMLVDSVRAALARYAGVSATAFTDGQRGVDAILAKQVATLSEDAPAWDDSTFPAPTLESSYEMKLNVNAPRYLVYDVGNYTYTGGAHGMYGRSSVTFEKPSGQRVTEFFLKENYARVRQMVAKALASQYFKCTMAELPENMTCPVDELPVGGGTVSLSGTGVVFKYQPYEISFYAAGAPECEIPFAQIRDLLLPQVRALID